jgi:hypothetical protein
MAQHFHDLIYSCMLTIRASDEALSLSNDGETVNQAGARIKRFGLRRMRALELIRQHLAALTKYSEVHAI